MPYDPDKDFTYVSGFDAGHLPLAVAAGAKAVNMREFVELARQATALARAGFLARFER